jgi:predicted RNA-binding Zn ribbon-like protein
MKMTARSDRFEWSGGHPALDFVNTLDDRPLERPVETLATYRDLVLFAELAGLIEPAVARKLQARSGPECLRIVTQARALREHFFRILAAAHAGDPPPQADLDAIAAAAPLARAARVLVAQKSGGLASYRWSYPRSVETPMHACALAVEGLLIMDIDRGRIRKCGASDCEVYFIDTSKGHRRRWCSMENCGNREKQRRWRAGDS